MSFLRQIGAGLTAAMVSSLMVLSALSLAAAEGLGETPVLLETATLPVELPGQITNTPKPSPTPPPPTNCPPPQGWTPYTILGGDTLEGLAGQYQLSPEMISQQNCLLSTSLLPGTILYLPPLPTATQLPVVEPTTPPTLPTPTSFIQPTVQRCGPPPGWVTYVVRPNDTLYRISLAFGVSVQELQLANCLSSPNLIQSGQVLYVPNVPTMTPTRTPSPVPTNQPPTATPVPPSLTPTEIPSATPVPATVTPSETPTSTSTITPSVTPSETPTASETPP